MMELLRRFWVWLTAETAPPRVRAYLDAVPL